MEFDDTSIGGRDSTFPVTTWSLISKIHQPLNQNRVAFEKLCLRYWKPVYRFIRLSWAKTNEDTKDLTQAFFLWLFEGEALTKYSPERGSFRRYLRILLGGFLGHEHEALQRLKRGGGKKILPLDDPNLVLQDQIPDGTTDPQKIFDRTWTAEVVRLALGRVRERLLSRGREVLYRAYEEYELASSGLRPTYAEVAEKIGVKESDVRNYLFEVREMIRAEIRAELTDTVTDEATLREEWNELFEA